MAQNPTDNKTVSLYEELNVSRARVQEIRTEIQALLDNSETISELLNSVPRKYDRESIIVGAFLCEIIFDNEGRLLPAGTNTLTKEIYYEMIARFLSELASGDITPRDIMGNPKRN